MRSSDWQYIGYVLVAVGGAFIITGAIALLNFQQGQIKIQYGDYFLPLLLVGLLLTVMGGLAFFKSKQKQSIPPPPPSPNPPPPPP